MKGKLLIWTRIGCAQDMQKRIVLNSLLFPITLSYHFACLKHMQKAHSAPPSSEDIKRGFSLYLSYWKHPQTASFPSFLQMKVLLNSSISSLILASNLGCWRAMVYTHSASFAYKECGVDIWTLRSWNSFTDVPRVPVWSLIDSCLVMIDSCMVTFPGEAEAVCASFLSEWNPVATQFWACSSAHSLE